MKQTKPESSHVQFWNMFMIIFGTVLASNREGGVGFDLHFRSVRCTRPNCVFPPKNFSSRSSRRIARALPHNRGLSPSRFSKRDPDSSHLALRNKCSVFGLVACRTFSGCFELQLNIFMSVKFGGFLKSANMTRAFFRKTAPFIYKR